MTLKSRIKLGFTLIELLVVIAIIGILTAVGTVSYSRSVQLSRDARRKTDLEQVRQALETYRSIISSYPTTAQGTGVLDPDYISVVPTGPKSDTYNYTSSGTTYTLCARLELTPASSTCTAQSCGTGSCNYSVTDP